MYNEVVWKELLVSSTNDGIRRYKQECLEHVESMEERRILKHVLQYRPK
jgi:hypothetical protein